jgi:hypothetical protein
MNRDYHPAFIAQQGNKRRKTFARYVREQTAQGKELVDFALRLLRGEKVASVLIPQTGEFIDAPPPISERVKAMEWLANRGFGKAETPDAKAEAMEELTAAFGRIREQMEPAMYQKLLVSLNEAENEQTGIRATEPEKEETNE